MVNLVRESLINSIHNKKDLVNIYAWLYFLTYVYYKNNGMSENAWKNDKRMGSITFIDAMYYLQKEGLVDKKDDNWIVKDRIKSKNKLFNIFGQYNSREEALDSIDKFILYNTKTYPISRIPFDIWSYEDEEQMVEPILSKCSYEYDDLIKWIKKYQRHKHNWSANLNKYLGKDGDLFRKNYKYLLYRGLYVDKDIVNGIKIGDKVINTRISWTLSYSIAKKFAFGNKHWMDNKNQIQQNKVGLIIKNDIDIKNILIDMYYADLKHPCFNNIIDFPDEYEVIVKPQKKMYEVIDVFNEGDKI